MSNPGRNPKFNDFDGTLNSFYWLSPHNLFCEATPLPDPVQSCLVDQKPIQSSPIRSVRTVQIFVHVVKRIGTYIFHLLTSFMNISVEFAARNPRKCFMFHDTTDLYSNMK